MWVQLMLLDVRPKAALAFQNSMFIRWTLVSHFGRTLDACDMRRARRTKGTGSPETCSGRPRDSQDALIRSRLSVKGPGLPPPVVRNAGRIILSRSSEVAKSPERRPRHSRCTRAQISLRSSSSRSNGCSHSAFHIDAVLNASGFACSKIACLQKGQLFVLPIPSRSHFLMHA